jgi:uncharacterized protein (TIRG00374 family)
MEVLRNSISRKRLALIIVGIIAILGGIAIFTDRNEILRVLNEANWEQLPLAFAFMILSYFLASYSFARVNQMLGIPLNTRALTQIGFTTTTINHLLTTGGLAGYSLRYLLMRDRGVRMKDILTTSVLHFYLTSLIMMGMLPVGLLYLILNSAIKCEFSLLIGVVTLLSILMFFTASGLVLRPSMRKPILNSVSRISRGVFRQDIDTQLNQFEINFTRGVSELRSQPHRMAWILAMIVGDWLSSAITLWFCFDALGPPVSPGDLMAGFVISIVAGVMSLIPGGLGVQEGSMAGIFSLLGTSFEQAILASILFRVVYYIFPYLISLLLIWRLLRQIDEEEVSDLKEVEYANSDT